eukprot:g5424.t1
MAISVLVRSNSAKKPPARTRSQFVLSGAGNAGGIGRATAAAARTGSLGRARRHAMQGQAAGTLKDMTLMARRKAAMLAISAEAGSQRNGPSPSAPPSADGAHIDIPITVISPTSDADSRSASPSHAFVPKQSFVLGLSSSLKRGSRPDPTGSLLVRAQSMMPGDRRSTTLEAAARARRMEARQLWEREVEGRERAREKLRQHARAQVLAQNQQLTGAGAGGAGEGAGARRRGLGSPTAQMVRLDPAYDDRNLLKREHYRTHPGVVKWLRRWWRTFGEHEGGSKKLNSIPRLAYFEMQHNIARVLLPLERKNVVQATLEAEWAAKPKQHADRLTEREFTDDLFDLVDLWTKTVEMKEYVELLEILLPFAAGKELKPEDEMEAARLEAEAGRAGGRSRWGKLRAAARMRVPRALQRWANVMSEAEAEEEEAATARAAADARPGRHRQTRKQSVEEAGPQPGWSVERVLEWLREHGLEALAPAFRKHGIDGAALRAMDEKDAQRFRMSCTRGQWKRLLQLVHGQEEMVRRAEEASDAARRKRAAAEEAKRKRAREVQELHKELRQRVDRHAAAAAKKAAAAAEAEQGARRAAEAAQQAERKAAARREEERRAQRAAAEEEQRKQALVLEQGWCGTGYNDGSALGGAGGKTLGLRWWDRVAARVGAGGVSLTDEERAHLFARLAERGPCQRPPEASFDWAARVPFDPHGLALLLRPPAGARADASAGSGTAAWVRCCSAADAAAASAGGTAMHGTGGTDGRADAKRRGESGEALVGRRSHGRSGGDGGDGAGAGAGAGAGVDVGAQALAETGGGDGDRHVEAGVAAGGRESPTGKGIIASYLTSIGGPRPRGSRGSVVTAPRPAPDERPEVGIVEVVDGGLGDDEDGVEPGASARINYTKAMVAMSEAGSARDAIKVVHAVTKRRDALDRRCKRRARRAQLARLEARREAEGVCRAAQRREEAARAERVAAFRSSRGAHRRRSRAHGGRL